MYKTQNQFKSIVHKHEIISNVEIANGVFVISFARTFDFIPGQVVSIQIDRNSPSRMYSIASGKDEELIRILFNINTDGYLTPILANLKPTETLYVSEPFGTFLRDVKQNDWLISAGTGIAPFNSYINSIKPDRMMVIHGARTLDQFYFENELNYLKEKYIRCCSKEIDVTVYPDRLTNYLKEIKSFDPSNTYYLCGSAEMVNDVREILIAKGISFEKIQSEIYF